MVSRPEIALQSILGHSFADKEKCVGTIEHGEPEHAVLSVEEAQTVEAEPAE